MITLRQMRHKPVASADMTAEERLRWTAAATGSRRLAERWATPDTGEEVSRRGPEEAELAGAALAVSSLLAQSAGSGCTFFEKLNRTYSRLR